jgi:hypothetical protein
MVAQWLRHYATSRKVMGLRPNEVNEFYHLPNPSSPSRPWVLLSVYKKRVSWTEIKMFLGNRAWLACEADNFTAMC